MSELIREIKMLKQDDGDLVLFFIVRGDMGVVSLALDTRWTGGTRLLDFAPAPRPMEVAYHAVRPVRKYHDPKEPKKADCALIGGQPCWADASYALADDLFEMICCGDDLEEFWGKLEEFYHHNLVELDECKED